MRYTLLVLLLLPLVLFAQKPKKKVPEKAPTYPPQLPGGKLIATDKSDVFLKRPATIRDGVTIAKTAPTVDFLYFPGQTYPGKPWSAWGDSLAVNGKYYTSIGDHLAPQGNGFVFEYDPAAKRLRQLVDVRKIINLPDGHYTPGKIHSRIDMGADGWLYFSTHRGSTRATTDANHYKGDWILRCHPESGKCEIVAMGAVPKHCIPCSVLDPKRLIFYGGTAPANSDSDGIHFFAFDVKARKLLFDSPNGPSRYMIFSKSTGRVYFNAGKEEGPLMRFDPSQSGKLTPVGGKIGIRAATAETPQGKVYTASMGRKGAESHLFSFDVKTEKIEDLGPAAVGTQQYIATLDADPTGRFLYYCAGAHGGSDTDGTPIVQFDVQTRQKKVIAFLHPFYQEKYGCTPRGTYSLAVDETGSKVYVTWNVSRGTRAWDCVAMTVVRVPESER